MAFENSLSALYLAVNRTEQMLECKILKLYDYIVYFEYILTLSVNTVKTWKIKLDILLLYKFAVYINILN